MTRYRVLPFCVIALSIFNQFIIVGSSGRRITKGRALTTEKTTKEIKPPEYGYQVRIRLFYQCKTENVVPRSECNLDEPEKINYDDTFVCCKHGILSRDSSTPRLGGQHTKFKVAPLYDASTAVVENCRYVPADQCRISLEDLQSGVGVLQPRDNTRRRRTEYCCPEEHIILPPGPLINESIRDCGMRNTGPDIFSNRKVLPDGSSTSFGEFPWMALVFTAGIDPRSTGEGFDNIICAASIISTKLVLTTGFCVCMSGVVDPYELGVRVGEYDMRLEANEEQEPHQNRRVSKVTVHPQFYSTSRYNDLALLEVAKPFVFGYHIGPICLPIYDDILPALDWSNCVTTGWGRNTFAVAHSQVPARMKRIDSTIVPKDQCEQELRAKTSLSTCFKLDSSFICAQGPPKETNTCEGNGGAPLVCPVRNNADKYVQVGVVSWCVGCANDLPVVYASLESNMDWLRREFDAVSRASSSRVVVEETNYNTIE